MEKVDRAVELLKEDLSAGRHEELVRMAATFLVTLDPDPRLVALRAWGQAKIGMIEEAAASFRELGQGPGQAGEVVATAGLGLVACGDWETGAALLRQARTGHGCADDVSLAAEALAFLRAGDRESARQAAWLLRHSDITHPALALLAVEFDPQLLMDLRNPKPAVDEGGGCRNAAIFLALIVLGIATQGIGLVVGGALWGIGVLIQRSVRSGMKEEGARHEQIPGNRGYRERIQQTRYREAPCPHCGNTARFWPEAGENILAGSHRHGFLVVCRKRACNARFDPPDEIGESVIGVDVLGKTYDFAPAVVFF